MKRKKKKIRREEKNEKVTRREEDIRQEFSKRKAVDILNQGTSKTHHFQFPYSYCYNP